MEFYKKSIWPLIYLAANLSDHWELSDHWVVIFLLNLLPLAKIYYSMSTILSKIKFIAKNIPIIGREGQLRILVIINKHNADSAILPSVGMFDGLFIDLSKFPDAAIVETYNLLLAELKTLNEPAKYR